MQQEAVLKPVRTDEQEVLSIPSVGVVDSCPKKERIAAEVRRS